MLMQQMIVRLRGTTGLVRAIDGSGMYIALGSWHVTNDNDNYALVMIKKITMKMMVWATAAVALLLMATKMVMIVYFFDNDCYDGNVWHPNLCPFTDSTHSNDKTICIYDTNSHKIVAKLKSGHKGHVDAVAFDSRGRHIVSGGCDLCLRCFFPTTTQM
jgi:WD40 repeat protein